MKGRALQRVAPLLVIILLSLVGQGQSRPRRPDYRSYHSERFGLQAAAALERYAVDDAARFLGQATELAPENPSSNLLLARLEGLRLNSEARHAALDKVRASAAHQPQLWWALIDEQLAAKEVDRARQDCDAFREMNNAPGWSYDLCAACTSARGGDRAEAQKHQKAARDQGLPPVLYAAFAIRCGFGGPPQRPASP